MSQARSAPDYVRAVSVAWLAADLVILVLYLLSLFLEPGFPRSVFSLNGELNLPAWFSAVQISFMAWIWVAIAVTAWSQSRRGPQAGAAIVVVALLFASVDEAVALHELIATETFDAAFPRTGYWVFVYLPIVLGGALAVLLLWRESLRAHASAFGLLALGGAIYVLAAGGVELLINAVVPGSALETLEVLIEEGGEMLGTTVAIWGSLRLLVEIRTSPT
jgi:hypothetical protein